MILVLFQPFFHQLAMMNTQIVKNQKDFMTNVFDQPFQESNESFRIHVVLVDHKADLALIRDRGNQVDSFTLGWKANCRSFPSGGITSAMLTVIGKPGFISPMNFGTYFFGFLGNCRILLVQPLLYGLRILFIGLAQWLLWGEAPAFQIFTHCPNRHLNRPQLLDQLLNRYSGPQGKW